MQIQSNLASTIAMAFDECAPALADKNYVVKSVERTTRWLERCKNEMARLNSLDDTINKEQMLFGINQGLFMMISVLNMQNALLSLIFPVMRLVVLP